MRKHDYFVQVRRKDDGMLCGEFKISMTDLPPRPEDIGRHVMKSVQHGETSPIQEKPAVEVRPDA